MAFTETEIRYIFEILETPYATGYNVMDGMGAIGSLTDIASNSSGQAKTQILAHLASMDATSIAMVQALVVQWIPVRLATSRVDDGNVGENAVTGVSYSSAEKRKRIQEAVQTYVNFFKFHEVLARRSSAGANSISIGTIW